jgi:hypothetical protein
MFINYLIINHTGGLDFMLHMYVLTMKSNIKYKARGGSFGLRSRLFTIEKYFSLFIICVQKQNQSIPVLSASKLNLKKYRVLKIG